MASSYQQFVKQHFASLPSHMSAKEKMTQLGKMWREQSGAMPKAKKASAKRGKKAMSEKGGSIFGDIVPFGHMLGLGLEEKSKKGKKTHAKRGKKAKSMIQEEHAGSIFGDIVPFGHMLGLGLEDKPKRGRKGVKGGVISGGIMSAAGLPRRELTRPIRGHSVHDIERMHAGSFGDYFFKGLTAPFRVAAALPIPGLQQIGTVGSKVFDALGV